MVELREPLEVLTERDLLACAIVLGRDRAAAV